MNRGQRLNSYTVEKKHRPKGCLPSLTVLGRKIHSMRSEADKSVIAGRCGTYQGVNKGIPAFKDPGEDSVCSILQLAELTAESD